MKQFIRLIVLENMMKNILVFVCLLGHAAAFAPSANPRPTFTQRFSSETATTETETSIKVDPKEAVKLFGRLAEKYIMLDASGDCEYRLPGGGYRMADQSASRPKWIPCYDERSFESSGKEHTSKWSIDLFTDGPAVNKEDFVSRLVDSKFAPPLGGPYVSASAAKIEDTTAAEALFDLLNWQNKNVLTKHSMGKRIKELADGEEGLTWNAFQEAMC